MNYNRDHINRLHLKPSRVALLLGVLALILVVISIAGQLITFIIMPGFVSEHTHVQGIIRMFDLDEERNVPTLYSVFLLLFSFILSLMIIILEKEQKAHGVSAWIMLCVFIFMMMSDEAFSFHEKLIEPMRHFLNREKLGIFYFAWVIPGAIMAFAFVTYFTFSFRNLGIRVKRLFLIAVLLYFGGAIGFELIGGMYEEVHGENLTYNMIATIEESLEMSGIIVFVMGLLVYVSERFKRVQLDMTDDESIK